MPGKRDTTEKIARKLREADVLHAQEKTIMGAFK